MKNIKTEVKANQNLSKEAMHGPAKKMDADKKQNEEPSKNQNTVPIKKESEKEKDLKGKDKDKGNDLVKENDLKRKEKETKENDLKRKEKEMKENDIKLKEKEVKENDIKKKETKETKEKENDIKKKETKEHMSEKDQTKHASSELLVDQDQTQQTKISKIDKNLENTKIKSINGKAQLVSTNPPSNNISSKKAYKILNNGGMFDAYQYLISNLCKNGLPTGDIYEYSAYMIQNYEKKWKEKKSHEIREKINKYWEEKEKEEKISSQDKLNRSLEEHLHFKQVSEMKRSKSAKKLKESSINTKTNRSEKIELGKKTFPENSKDSKKRIDSTKSRGRSHSKEKFIEPKREHSAKSSKKNVGKNEKERAKTKDLKRRTPSPLQKDDKKSKRDDSKDERKRIGSSPPRSPKNTLTANKSETHILKASKDEKIKNKK